MTSTTFDETQVIAAILADNSGELLERSRALSADLFPDPLCRIVFGRLLSLAPGTPPGMALVGCGLPEPELQRIRATLGQPLNYDAHLAVLRKARDDGRRKAWAADLEAGRISPDDFEARCSELRAAAPAKEAGLIFDGTAYWRRERDGNFGKLQRPDALLHLKLAGFKTSAPPGEPSPADRALNQIQTNHRATYCGPICGRAPGLITENGVRVLVTRGPAPIVPSPGDCPTITSLLANLLGHAAGDALAARQAEVFVAWLKFARLAVRSTELHRPGQVLALVGPPDCGKSLVQSMLVTPALGGRVADPSLWMTGGTTFNSDLWGAEHLAIGDKGLGDDARQRARLRDELKMVTAASDYLLHPKNRDALTLRPIWRVTLSANDDPESATSLPALNSGFDDKIIYLQCYAPPGPFFDEAEPGARAGFEMRLRAELPAFLHDVDSFVVPPELLKGRFGVREFHHPNILDLIESSSPLVPLGQALELWIRGWAPETETVELPAVALYAALDEHLDKRLRTISSGPAALGHQLARLAGLESWRGRVKRFERRIGDRRTNQKQTAWAISRVPVAP